MTALDAPRLADALADERLLEPEQYEAFVATMLPVCQDVPILARELVYRGWLTPYQAEQILAGRGRQLILGSYVLLEPLGEGGMGRVFRARNWKLDRVVAVKVIRDEQARRPEVIARFQREIRALGRINHPNIVMAVDADFRPGMTYYAMEYVEGCDLARLVRQRGPLPVAAACDVVMQVAEALRHAHDLGLIHRDVKPSNLLLTEPGRVVKVLDLGLTRCEVPVNDSAFDALTHVGALIGTPDFMSPEQARDSRSADIRSDLYSLGCTFYYLLAGVAPFEHLPAVVDKLCAQCEREPAPLRELRPDAPPDVAEVVHKLMAKRRRERFQTAGELLGALGELESVKASACRETLVDVWPVTLSDCYIGPVAAPELPGTEIVSHEELGLVPPADEADEVRRAGAPRRSLRPAQIIIAVLLAAAAILLMSHAGLGPRTLQGREPPAQPPAAVEPRDDPAIDEDESATLKAPRG